MAPKPPKFIVRETDKDDPNIIDLQERILPLDFILEPDADTRWWLPDDPDGREAGMLAHRFLHGDRNPEILDTLFANEGNPAYRLALEVLKHCMRAMGADIPERLRVWKPDSKSVKERRWRREPIQHHLIGMVVEALVIGNNILFRWEKSKRKQERLQGNRTVLARVFWDDPAFITSTSLNGKFSLRLCILNHSTTWNDVLETLESIKRFGIDALASHDK